MRDDRPARGPRPTYSRAQLTKAAVGIADAEGMGAVSIRRVAAAVGAGTMSVYRYVSGRDDLVELMVDAVTGELDLPPKPSRDWRADLSLVAHQVRALGRRHPWWAKLVLGRPVLGPNTLRLIEFGFGALDGYGLPIDEMISLYGLLDGYVRNFVRDEVGWADEERRTGIGIEQWTSGNSHIEQLVASGKYPIFTRMVFDARQPHMAADSRFEYGLNRVLDCIAASLSNSDNIG
jgi:AcrR family transcriptional regulator